MKCATCSEDFQDGVQCASCKQNLDFSCAGITEGGWRRLGTERRNVWKCPSCRTLSPLPVLPSSAKAASPEPASLDIILREIRDMKSQLKSLPTLVSDVKVIKDELLSIKREIADLKASNNFLSNQIEEHTDRLTVVETRVSNLEPMQADVDALRSELQAMKLELSFADQRSRQNNVELKGIPTKNNENLFTIVEAVCKKVNYLFPKSQINYIYRIPIYGSKEKAIVVSFLNRYVKEEFMAAARASKDLTAADVGFKDATNRVYVNDHLNADVKALLSKTKSLATEKNYSYVWVKYGKIHIRKNDTSRVLIIARQNDLNKMI